MKTAKKQTRILMTSLLSAAAMSHLACGDVSYEESQQDAVESSLEQDTTKSMDVLIEDFKLTDSNLPALKCLNEVRAKNSAAAGDNGTLSLSPNSLDLSDPAVLCQLACLLGSLNGALCAHYADGVCTCSPC